MIPIMYEPDAVLPDQYNGVTAFPYGNQLSDCLSAVVTEELNNKYELVITYPATGAFADDIMVGKIIAATPNQWRHTDEDGMMWNVDYFRVYKVSKTIGNVFTVNAEHISYNLSNQLCMPFTASTLGVALIKIAENYRGYQPFYYHADQEVQKSFTLSSATSIRDAIFQIAEHYGIELEFIHYDVRFYVNGRGRHTDDWQIRYGVNLTEFKMDMDYSTAYTEIAPYMGTVKGSELSTGFNDTYGQYERRLLLDCSSLGASATSSSITSVANAWKNERIAENFYYFYPTATITCTPISEETTQGVVIGDSALVVVPKYGIEQRSNVTSYEWDVLLNRYKKLTIGAMKKNIGEIIAGIEEKK